MIGILLINIIILLNISLEQNITNIIVLPFKTYREPYDNSNPINISSIVNNHIYTEIEISDQILVASFKSDEYGFYMTSENCIEKSNYLIQKSKSFTNLTDFTKNKEGFASERMLLYRDIDLKIKQFGYFKEMRIKTYNNERQCAIFGLKMKSDIYEFIKSFIKTFKENTNIKSYEWTLKYTSNDEGLLVLGDTPLEYDPNFKNKEYFEYTINAIKYKNYLNFGMKFNEISINNVYLNGSKEVQFFHDLGVIFVDKNYFDYIENIFFTKYLDKYICVRDYVALQYIYIRCHCNFTENDLKSFPTIYFKHKEINYTFELNYNDLFLKEKDGNIYFLIFFDLNYDAIKIGKPFLKKYTFTVDNDKNTISFLLTKNVENNDSNNILVIVVIVMSIVFVILIGIIIFVLYKLWQKNGKTKKRANELDDDYDYMTQSNPNTSDNKLGI